MDSKIKYYLQIADSALIYGYRLRELSLFNTPFLTSLSQSDLTNQLLNIADTTYKEVNGLYKKLQAQPFLIVRKNPEEYFNAILFELENEDELFVIVRQFLVDTFHSLFYQELMKSKDQFLSNLAKEKVELFKSQVEKSRLWFKELKFLDLEKYKQVQKNLNVLWEYSADFFQASTADLIMLSKEFGVDLHKIQLKWKIAMEKAILEEGFNLPTKNGTLIGGKEGRHSKSFHSILKSLKTSELRFR